MLYRSIEEKKKKINISKNEIYNLIHSPGYKKNISLGRLKDHANLAINLSLELKKYEYFAGHLLKIFSVINEF